MNSKTFLAVALLALLSGCACERPAWKNPYGPAPAVGFGPANPAHYGDTPYPGGVGRYAYYGGAVPPYGANLANWGPFGGLGGWGGPTPGLSSGRGK